MLKGGPPNQKPKCQRVWNMLSSEQHYLNPFPILVCLDEIPPQPGVECRKGTLENLDVDGAYTLASQNTLPSHDLNLQP